MRQLSKPIHILVHDFSGHPFQVQLSRHLASRGYLVTHLHCTDIVGAKGSIEKMIGDPVNFFVDSISIGRNINRYNFLKRLLDERKYGKVLSSRVRQLNPDVVISANTPLDAQVQLFNTCRSMGVRFIFWLQDVLGIASKSVLSKKLGLLGSIIGDYYIRTEKSLLKNSDHIVPISEDFKFLLFKWGVETKNISVINNWAPLEEMPQFPVENDWRVTQGLEPIDRVAIYSGALGLKHNPQLLWDLAKDFEKKGPNFKLIVISEGYGANWLKKKLHNENLPNLKLLPFQPFELLPKVLASANVLLAILEPEAGEFCVPSKVLSYMCVGRPIALAAARSNLASKLVSNNICGMVSEPSNSSELCENVSSILAREDLVKSMGVNSRLYAEENFDIVKIADKFETIIQEVTK